MKIIALKIAFWFLLGAGGSHLMGMTSPEACLLGMIVMTAMMGIELLHFRFIGLVLMQFGLFVCLTSAESRGVLLAHAALVNGVTAVIVAITATGVFGLAVLAGKRTRTLN